MVVPFDGPSTHRLPDRPTGRGLSVPSAAAAILDWVLGRRGPPPSWVQDVSVDHRREYVTVAKELLNGPYVAAVLGQMGQRTSEAVYVQRRYRSVGPGMPQEDPTRQVQRLGWEPAPRKGWALRGGELGPPEQLRGEEHGQFVDAKAGAHQSLEEGCAGARNVHRRQPI